MSKDTSFLIAEDPQRPELGHYILHTGQPIALIRVLSMDDDDPVSDDQYICADYPYTGDDGYTEVFQLIVSPFTDGIVEFNRDDEMELRKLLGKAWAWYLDYLQWHDSQEK